jgi:hypothetical protein
VRSPGRTAPRPFGGQPGPGLQPVDEVVLHLRVGEVAVAVGLLDLAGVQPVGAVAGGVLLEHPRVGDAELRRQVRRDRPRHVGRVGQERPQEPDGAELNGEPEAVVLAAPHVAVGRVEVEVAVELRLVRLAGVPAVAALLLSRL